MDYPVLNKAYKGRYPFRLGTTSFIYPDGYARNVEMLAPFFDEIELLMFESRSSQSLPPASEIRRLHQLAQAHALSYSVHLPIDILPGSADTAERRHAVNAVRRTLAVTAELEPRSCILHLPCPGFSAEETGLGAWQNNNRRSLQAMLDNAAATDRICIENLDYPIRWYAPLLEEFGLKMCLDVGHLLRRRIAPEAVLERFLGAISVIHLHGVENGRDHLPLGSNNCHPLQPLIRLLRSFNGSLCIEVFAYDHLVDSLSYFEEQWRREADPPNALADAPTQPKQNPESD